MVRLKQRYILFDILYPPEPNGEEFDTFSDSPRSALLSLYQSSSTLINPKTLTQVIRKILQDHYGDFGAGTAGMLISVKYFNNKTSTGILRCSRQSFHLVMASLTLLNRIGKREVIVRCLHVSGTIKKCEEFSIKRNKNLMLVVKLGKKDNSNGVNQFINNFEQNEAFTIENDVDDGSDE